MFSKDLIWYIVAVVACSLSLSMQLVSMLTACLCKTQNGFIPCLVLAFIFLTFNCYYISKLGKTIKIIKGIEAKEK